MSRSPLVPAKLQPTTSSLWRFARTLTTTFGTELARRGAVGRAWGLPATVVWWLILIAFRSSVANWRGAYMALFSLTGPRLTWMRWVFWLELFAVPLALLGATVFLAVTGSTWAVLVPVLLALIFVMSAVEMQTLTRRAITGAPQLQHVLPLVRARGHEGPLVSIGFFVDHGDQDGGVLGRAVLEHMDVIGAAIVTEAADHDIAKLYVRAGFQPTPKNRLVVFRLPGALPAAQASRSTEPTTD